MRKIFEKATQHPVISCAAALVVGLVCVGIEMSVYHWDNSPTLVLPAILGQCLAIFVMLFVVGSREKQRHKGEVGNPPL